MEGITRSHFYPKKLQDSEWKICRKFLYIYLQKRTMQKDFYISFHSGAIG
jgi:hypothetical protein